MTSSKIPIYLDNAATTPIDPEVWKEMQPYFEQFTANPSSIHSHGRQAKVIVEKARKTIATLLNAAPSEIFFTSGGTEADNTVIQSCVLYGGIKTIITSPLEHHAVLHTAQAWEKLGMLELKMVSSDSNGVIDLADLESLLSASPNALVSLMQGNNEIGNLLDLHAVGNLCEKYGALFHSDTVQTMGHFVHDVQNLPVHFLVGAGHKFHGPKGIGFLYAKSGIKFSPMMHGGAQERNQRGGTENVYGMVGIAKALSIAYEDMAAHEIHIKDLKTYFIQGLQNNFPGIEFNGLSSDIEKSLYTVLNVRFPQVQDGDMLLFKLDIEKISASGGSACSSGTSVGSHVLTALNPNAEGAAVRFSFSKNNTRAEIDRVLEVLSKIIN
jgi:cysteine desulfurase